jgi:hypothetical protein
VTSLRLSPSLALISLAGCLFARKTRDVLSRYCESSNGLLHYRGSCNRLRLSLLLFSIATEFLPFLSQSEQYCVAILSVCLQSLSWVGANCSGRLRRSLKVIHLWGSLALSGVCLGHNSSDFVNFFYDLVGLGFRVPSGFGSGLCLFGSLLLYCPGFWSHCEFFSVVYSFSRVSRPAMSCVCQWVTECLVSFRFRVVWHELIFDLC